MFTVGQILRLKDGAYEEYKRRHDELWPEMVQAMNSLGINMGIYRYKELLFLFGTAPHEQAWKDMENHPVTPRWDQYMSDVLEPVEGDKYYVDLPCAFTFGDFAACQGTSPDTTQHNVRDIS